MDKNTLSSIIATTIGFTFVVFSACVVTEPSPVVGPEITVRPAPIIASEATTGTTASQTRYTTDYTSFLSETETEETSTEMETETVYIPDTEEPISDPEYIEEEQYEDVQAETPETEYNESTQDEPVYHNSYYNYSEWEVELLAMLINAESSGSWIGDMYVASTVMNRMDRQSMTVSGVIYQENQFTTAYSLPYYNAQNYECALWVLENGTYDSSPYFFTGGHSDGLNHFKDYYGNWIGNY